MRIVLIISALLALAACQPSAGGDANNAEAEATGADEVGSFTPGLQVLSDENSVTLNDMNGPNKVAFSMGCKKGSKVLGLSADRDQFQKDINTIEGALVASGQSFANDDVFVDQDNTSVTMTVDLTPDVLAAVRDATTVRLALADSFGESNVDAANVFEDFAAKCAALSGVTPKPAP
jgi:hypothetical protein